ncbi:MAG TPA: hypothetical protein VFJ72_07935 [Rubrobacteraceae bacterium]|nr:hypothetical protein [Rubrobacteraceae bacterium]
MNVIFDRWFKTWPERAGVALISALAIALALLGLMGSDTGFWVLVVLLGVLIGHLSAYSVSMPFRGRFVRRFDSWADVVAFVSGFALGLMLLLIGAFFVGSPSFFSDGGGMSGALVYGLALGVPQGLRSGLVPRPQPGPEQVYQSRRAILQGILIVAGALFTILALAFGLYALIQYILGPLIRYFAG